MSEESWRADLAETLQSTRRRTLDLVAPLNEASLRRQVSDLLSPLIWDLGHIASVEDAWLVRAITEDRAPVRLDNLYDAARETRSSRGNLGLPPADETVAWLKSVRERTLRVLAHADSVDDDPLLRDGYVYRMVIQHEAQHQETMLQALDLPADDWVYPVVAPGDSWRGAAASPTEVDDTDRVSISGGAFVMGTDDRTRAYDNERAEHEATVYAFAIDRYPVSNRRWVEFIADDGYQRPELWSVEGRAWLAETGARAPQGWSREASEWKISRLGVHVPVDPLEPVQHVNYREAEAFATWAGGRLPSEAEWEKAAAWSAVAHRPAMYPWGDEAPGRVGLVETDSHGVPDVHAARGPGRIGERPELASPYGVEDLLGNVYEWTSSAFTAYPGFAAFPYPEYSEVFFGGPYRVLRGSSWAAHPMLWRNTYRNWDLPQRRQIFAGLRVAYEVQ